MITDVDAHLHKPNDDPAWAETNYFGFYVPERNLNCGVYALWRPNLGVVLSTICLNSSFWILWKTISALVKGAGAY